MQIVLHDYQNIHNVFTQMERLYANISGDVKKGLLAQKYYPEFKALDNIFKDYIYDYEPLNFLNIHPFLDIITAFEDNMVIVCCSGGKDSVAVAKYYKDLGKSVMLYHMRGINKVYTDEYIAVMQIANYLNVPYYIDKVTLSGTQRFTEHPMKNYIIMNGAIHYALENNLPLNIAFGNYTESHLEDSPFDVCAGDCAEMWDAYEHIVRPILPLLRILNPLKDQSNTWDILKCDTNLIGLSQSCISPQRFREHWHKRTCDTYKIELPNHRCGCCWKCAVEYIRCSDMALQELNLAYYIHCIEILSNTLTKELGLVSKSVQSVWERYIDYDISESIIGDKLKDAVIQGKYIKISQEPTID